MARVQSEGLLKTRCGLDLRRIIQSRLRDFRWSFLIGGRRTMVARNLRGKGGAMGLKIVPTVPMRSDANAVSPLSLSVHFEKSS